MKDVAYISFAGGGLIVSVQTPYEHELLVEHLERFTRRHGRVGLEMNRRYWTVSMNRAPGKVCASCTRWPDTLTYRLDGQSFCGHCARRALH